MVDRLTPRKPVLEADEGQTASTELIYHSDNQDFAIWSRLGPGDRWKKENPETDGNNTLTGGVIKTRDIGPGQVLEYAMLASSTADPNGTDFAEDRFVARAMIMCVRKNARGADWHKDHSTPAEGTFATIGFHGQPGTAFALLIQLGKLPAFIDPNGLPVVPDPVMSRGSPAFRQEHTGLIFTPLDPGQTYFWSAVMMDAQGSYWGKTFPNPITTKLRRIAITLHNINVSDDGDADLLFFRDTNDIDITVDFKRNNLALVQASIPIKNIDDKNPSHKSIKIGESGTTIVLGPSSGSFDDTFSISVFVKDDDGDTSTGGFILPNNNSNEPARLPFGPGEKLDTAPFPQIHVGDDIVFDMSFRLKVDYI